MDANSLNELKEYYTFDDVLILPTSSEIEPNQADLSTKVSKNISLKIPILSAIMDRVTETEMAIALSKLGGLGVLHRNNSIEEQVRMLKEVKSEGLLCGAGCGPFDVDRAIALDNAGCDVIFIDCSHGHNSNVIKSAQKIKKSIKADLVVGNIATAQAAKELVDFADGIKVGVGPGSICTTRIVSGVGVPQLSAIISVSEIAKKYNIPVIADGGMSSPGDGAKALAAGANSLMFGSLLAGTDESPGKIIFKNSQKVKEYRGMGSLAVLSSNKSSDRYLQHNQKNKIPEGVEGYVEYTGPLKNQINYINGGLKIAFGFVGAKNISAFQRRAKFIKITQSSLTESYPHGIIK